ncbi:MAG: RNA-binding protein [Gemmatimonadaceae bacterium]|nr:RNA-binding protein [Planctomycetota bacterium]NUQ10895.1 RNA-binding protein [Gemmatimonadaceae bacterium]
MANRTLFASRRGALTPTTDSRNHEGSPAYAFPPKHALAQYAATGCLNGTFYAGAEDQLGTVLGLAQEVDAEFVAKTAVHCRARGAMKDMPALLLAVLSVKDKALFARVFDRVVDDGRMLRTFVQILRSGAVGRKSLGTLPKRKVLAWLDARSEQELVRASVGNSPSLADIVRMVHPRPATPAREALYGWLLGRPHDAAALPQSLRDYEDFKAGKTKEVPDVPFLMLTSLDLDVAGWRTVARRATVQQTRMNLNTFARHGVFGDPAGGSLLGRMFRDGDEGRAVARLVAERLRDRDAIRKARVLPYQLLAARASVDETVPAEVRDALQDAVEVALECVPAVEGRVVVCPDLSGSMMSPVTGNRGSGTTKVRCIDVAALVAAAVLRKNPGAQVLPFNDDVVKVRLEGRDTVLTNAERLAKAGGGGTNCSAPIRLLNDGGEAPDLVVFVSDNQSWVDARAGRGTAQLAEWNELKARNPRARLVCIDIQPYGTTQAAEREDILNVGGFSDAVFEVVAEFAAGRLAPGHWVEVIEKEEI